ncbi:receptor-mediated endocytosis protein 6 homolog isoform X2 [Topomyia yanbarensis]|uniref:receptor-mediated endocytosis protein 6 homolog isoform X2 n=1 Tax=Topomyia yanbarensis TaxID=2498891 RepID=UPI00273B2829|nr:receptor-mediated endocytosis protein 6 homolog isoform X2 [Topomyia yanbarensis]
MESKGVESFWAVVNLARTLRREYMFIANEQTNVLNLHETYERNMCKTLQIAWICANRRQIINNLITANPEFGPSLSCQQTNKLENVQFLDVRQTHCISLAESRDTPVSQIDIVIGFIVNGLYGSAIHSRDAKMIIKLLQVLIETQIVVSDNPRRLLCAGSSAFTRLFQRYHETSFAAKLFLKTVLFEPIMTVLMQDEWKLEIDPQKIIYAQSTIENVNFFGEEASSEYLDNLQSHKQKMIDRLFSHVSRFLKSLSENWCLLPSTIRWMLQSIYHFLTRAKISKKEVNIILTDMIFTNFICPAMVNPNIYGIIDAAISDNTRYNLMLIGHILQTLALNDYHSVEDQLQGFLRKFDRNCISNLMNQLLQGEFSGSCEYRATIDHHITNKVVLATINELASITDLLATALELDTLEIKSEERRKIMLMLEQLPDFTESISGNVNFSTDSISPKTDEKSKSKLRERMQRTRTISNHPLQNNNQNDFETVFMIPLTSTENGKILTEEELLNNISIEISDKDISQPYIEQKSTQNNSRKLTIDKRKSFSLPHDDASGNTSDNLEAVSEAHSNHSVASSLELEEADQNDNDNLSDMISANVSGRGTPNISGRDTPSSQITEGGEVQQFAIPQMSKISNKTRSDIEDKFCKFEIKKLIEGDETISIISDTWSTDVLASDSEAIEASERHFSTPLIHTTLIPGDHNLNPLASSFGQLRITSIDSETQSESAWSTDAIMDTEDVQNHTARSESDSVVREREVPTNNLLYLTKASGIRCTSSDAVLFQQYQVETSQNSSNQLVTASNISSNSENIHNARCLQPSARQNSTDSYNSNSGSESKARLSSSDTNENNIQMHCIEKTGYQKCHAGKDRNDNTAKCIDHRKLEDLMGRIRPCNRTTGNPFENSAEFDFSPTNNSINSYSSNSSTHQSNTDHLTNVDDEITVEHRRLSSEQRNAKFDSRRNGMIDVGNFSNSFSFTDDYLNRETQLMSSNNIMDQPTNPISTGTSMVSTVSISIGEVRLRSYHRKQFF